MTKDRLFSTCILLFCLLMYVATYDFASGPTVGAVGPEVFPRAVIAVTALLAGISLLTSFINKSEKRIDLRGVPHKYRAVGFLLLLFLLYAFALPVVGFVPATLGFMFIGQATLRGLSRRKDVITNVVVTVLSTLVVYFVFTEALNILLP